MLAEMRSGAQQHLSATRGYKDASSPGSSRTSCSSGPDSGFSNIPPCVASGLHASGKAPTLSPLPCAADILTGVAPFVDTTLACSIAQAIAAQMTHWVQQHLRTPDGATAAAATSAGRADQVEALTAAAVAAAAAAAATAAANAVIAAAGESIQHLVRLPPAAPSAPCGSAALRPSPSVLSAPSPPTGDESVASRPLWPAVSGSLSEQGSSGGSDEAELEVEGHYDPNAQTPRRQTLVPTNGRPSAVGARLDRRDGRKWRSGGARDHDTFHGSAAYGLGGSPGVFDSACNSFALASVVGQDCVSGLWAPSEHGENPVPLAPAQQQQWSLAGPQHSSQMSGGVADDRDQTMRAVGSLAPRAAARHADRHHRQDATSVPLHAVRRSGMRAAAHHCSSLPMDGVRAQASRGETARQAGRMAAAVRQEGTPVHALPAKSSAGNLLFDFAKDGVALADRACTPRLPGCTPLPCLPWLTVAPAMLAGVPLSAVGDAGSLPLPLWDALGGGMAVPPTVPPLAATDAKLDSITAAEVEELGYAMRVMQQVSSMAGSLVVLLQQPRWQQAMGAAAALNAARLLENANGNKPHASSRPPVAKPSSEAAERNLDVAGSGGNQGRSMGRLSDVAPGNDPACSAGSSAREPPQPAAADRLAERAASTPSPPCLDGATGASQPTDPATGALSARGCAGNRRSPGPSRSAAAAAAACAAAAPALLHVTSTPAVCDVAGETEAAAGAGVRVSCLEDCEMHAQQSGAAAPSVRALGAMFSSHEPVSAAQPCRKRGADDVASIGRRCRGALP